MKETKTDAGTRAARHLGEMVEREMVMKLSEKYSKHGAIPADDLERALVDVEWAIGDFERSPTGPSTRNALVLALVRRTCVDRLRKIAGRISGACEACVDLPVEELRSETGILKGGGR